MMHWFIETNSTTHFSSNLNTVEIYSLTTFFVCFFVSFTHFRLHFLPLHLFALTIFFTIFTVFNFGVSFTFPFYYQFSMIFDYVLFFPHLYMYLSLYLNQLASIYASFCASQYKSLIFFLRFFHIVIFIFTLFTSLLSQKEKLRQTNHCNVPLQTRTAPSILFGVGKAQCLRFILLYITIKHIQI